MPLPLPPIEELHQDDFGGTVLWGLAGLSLFAALVFVCFQVAPPAPAPTREAYDQMAREELARHGLDAPALWPRGPDSGASLEFDALDRYGARHLGRVDCGPDACLVQTTRIEVPR